ncbi:YkgJ family cysteine cluster protein [Plebeiibacterium marinum]|uniref:YkgJ family cysteine cluster protein n=1 Tax=Plebeiibacterium marinum TaxID=2992111 RepID=A0AAE3SLK7_9BACT|nr:YkgJ family cysteine cluster protein [Plebeiobacterium marinum]MCW3807965.1 YkgJ family cysteine cluster protein [Plebeiobacterium marinum]
MGNTDKSEEKRNKEANLEFYKDGYTIASREVVDFDSLTPLFKGMQVQYTVMSQLTQTFAMRAHQEGKAIQCEKGCSWCCYQPVYMTTQEAVLIFEFLHQAMDEAQRKKVLNNAVSKYKKTKGLTEEQKQSVKAPCPFLNQGSCSVYPVRPMACRIYLSSDKQSCKNKYDAPGDSTMIPALYDFVLRAGRYMNEGFVGFLKGKGRKMEEYTIEEFVVKLFREKDFIQNWMVEDYFGESEGKDSKVE